MIQSIRRMIARLLGVPKIMGRGRALETRYNALQGQIRQTQQRADSLRRLVVKMRGYEDEIHE